MSQGYVELDDGSILKDEFSPEFLRNVRIANERRDSASKPFN